MPALVRCWTTQWDPSHPALGVGAHSLLCAQAASLLGDVLFPLPGDQGGEKAGQLVLAVPPGRWDLKEKQRGLASPEDVVLARILEAGL